MHIGCKRTQPMVPYDTRVARGLYIEKAFDGRSLRSRPVGPIELVVFIPGLPVNKHV